MNDNLYDIDHIYPQSKIKDDSFDNTVLVKKEYNSKKGDGYLFEFDWQKKQMNFWNILKEK